jgi:hypothetical protein
MKDEESDLKAVSGWWKKKTETSKFNKNLIVLRQAV